jgi:hypothetical protein
MVKEIQFSIMFNVLEFSKPTELNVPEFLRCASALDSLSYTVRSESRCALRLRSVHLAVSTAVAVAVCCCFTAFIC